MARWQVLTRWGFKLKDWIDEQRQARKIHYTQIQVFVPRPQLPGDTPTLWVSISCGPRAKVGFRLRDLVAWDKCWAIAPNDRARLERQLQEAHDQAAELTEAERLGFFRKEGLLQRLDTGEPIPPTGSLRPTPGPAAPGEGDSTQADWDKEFCDFLARPTDGV